MQIIFNEDEPVNEMKLLFERAAELALDREGISCEGLEVSLSYVSSGEMERLNNQYRGKEGPTDVLSFPMYEGAEEARKAAAEAAADGAAPVLLGDVVLCREVAEQQARSLGHSAGREMLYLFVHSMFHLLGYDHEGPDGGRRVMRDAEEDVLRGLGEVL